MYTESARVSFMFVKNICLQRAYWPPLSLDSFGEEVSSLVVPFGVDEGGTQLTLDVQTGVGILAEQAKDAKHGQTALDGEGENSPFAVAMVQRVATPGVEINKLFRLVRDDVMEATAGRQEPFTYGSLPGREDFFFVNR